MNLCNGCKNAGEIISMEASVKEYKRYVDQLVAQDSDRRREITEQSKIIGNMGLKLIEANRTIKRLQVELDAIEAEDILEFADEQDIKIELHE